MHPLLLAFLLFTCQCISGRDRLGFCDWDMRDFVEFFRPSSYGRSIYKSPESATSMSSTNSPLVHQQSIQLPSLIRHLLLVKSHPRHFCIPKVQWTHSQISSLCCPLPRSAIRVVMHRRHQWRRSRNQAPGVVTVSLHERDVYCLIHIRTSRH
ncbi:hypothetical protein C8R48DRAFT_363786 [Suillus tomentosus]|nr:hypothetical protein C8R48DRAFT_363786 [Suillus tomentosus]